MRNKISGWGDKIRDDSNLRKNKDEVIYESKKESIKYCVKRIDYEHDRMSNKSGGVVV